METTFLLAFLFLSALAESYQRFASGHSAFSFCNICCQPCLLFFPAISRCLLIIFTSLSRSLTPKQMAICSVFSHSERSVFSRLVKHGPGLCNELRPFLVCLENPDPTRSRPAAATTARLSRTRRGAQCYLVSTTLQPFLRENKGGILMKTLGVFQEDGSREGRSQCLLSRLVFVSLACRSQLSAL